MKRDSLADTKLLHKKYPFFDKPDIEILYHFCNQSHQRTNKVLTALKDTKNPKFIIKFLLQKPQKGQSMILNFQKKYDQEQNLQTRKLKKDKNQQKSSLLFFRYIPEDLTLSIILFLDPYSMLNFSSTSHKFLTLYNKTKPFSQYFRKLCINLFEKYTQQFPQIPRFTELKVQIIKNGKNLSPNFTHAVQTNLRKFVWEEEIKIQKMPISSYLSFGGYREIFFNAPRIHYNGYYLWQHRYRKEQQKDLLTNQGNVFLIKYYRYLRFFEDGSVISVIFPQKQKKQVLIEYLSVKNLSQHNMDNEKINKKQIMIGEYDVKKDLIELKIAKSLSIFSYKLRINPVQDKLALTILMYKMKVISNNQIIQDLLSQTQNDCPVGFKYFPCRGLAHENSYNIQASSL